MTSTWFITGASRGFGRELTEQLLARGDRVAATLRKPEQLADLAATYGDRLWIHGLDVTDTAQLRAVVNAAFTELDRIDVVVSNAGYGVVGAAEELSDTQIEELIATNLIASIQLARAVTPHLRAQGGGRLLQMSSMGGLIGFPGFSLYHTTKWGIEGFFEAFAPEVEPFGIRTTLIEPGMIRTSFYSALERAPKLEAYADNRAITRGDTPLENINIGWILVVLGVFFFLWFLSALRQVLRQTDGDGFLTTLATVGGGVYAATTLVGWSVNAAVKTMSDDTFGHRVFPELIHAADDAGYVIHAAGGIGIGTLMIATSVVTMRAGRIPGWAGWVGIVFGILALGSIFFFPQLLIFLWLLVAGVAVFRAAPGSPAATAAA